MTDPSTPARRLGGPDLTPMKSVDDPIGPSSWIGSGAGRLRPARGSSNSIANWMFRGGALAFVLGAILLVVNQGNNYEGDTELMYVGGALSAAGGQVAILGLLALALRQK